MMDKIIAWWNPRNGGTPIHINDAGDDPVGFGLVPLYAAPVSEAERQKDAALIEQLAHALSVGWSPYYINGIDARKLSDEALAAVEEWRKGK